MIDAELMVIYDPITTSYSRGDGKWFAQFYDRATAGFYAGTGATALEAIAWAIDEYTVRGILKIHRVARGPEERPGNLYREARRIAEDMGKSFEAAWARTPPPRIVPIVIQHVIAGELTEASADKVEALARSTGSCFELQIDDAKRANEPPKKRKKAKGT